MHRVKYIEMKCVRTIYQMLMQDNIEAQEFLDFYQH